MLTFQQHDHDATELPAALRTAYGIIGVLLARHGYTAEISEQTCQAIERGHCVAWTPVQNANGSVTLRLES